ncbi:MAG: hypothetical protein R2941_16385 [Desulfobacterales bacterium]
MRPVTGNRKQEAKISELGNIAGSMFPHIKPMLFKGAFRHGIKAALEKNLLRNWEEVSKKPPEARRAFLHSALDESVRHLRFIGLTEDEAKHLLLVLKVRNEKYLVQ